MKIDLTKTVDEEFQSLRIEGRTGSINDMISQSLTAQGLTGSVNDLLHRTSPPPSVTNPTTIMGSDSISWFSAASSDKWQDSGRTVVASSSSDPVYTVSDEEGGFFSTNDNALRSTLGVEDGVTFIDVTDAHLSRALTLTQTLGVTMAFRIPLDTYEREAVMVAMYPAGQNPWWGSSTLLVIEENTAPSVQWVQARNQAFEFPRTESLIESRGWVVLQFKFDVDTPNAGEISLKEDGVSPPSAPTVTPTVTTAAPGQVDIGRAQDSAYTVNNGSNFDLAAIAFYDITNLTTQQEADLLTWAGNEIGRTL